MRRTETWSAKDDALLAETVKKLGKKWSEISRVLNKARKQCRERWLNHLDPELRTDQWSFEEDRAILQLVCEHGKKWAMIARRLPKGRTENSVKNRYNSVMRAQKHLASPAESSPVVNGACTVSQSDTNSSAVESQEYSEPKLVAASEVQARQPLAHVPGTSLLWHFTPQVPVA
eukprot:c8783_g1_i1.p1 GENE.c8783_g1_i1~~c8783_g1_i1.p1  ORF type:complete len:174 (+),score=14.61 c8783_g1_i1:549-1070(+)